jgi:HEAT repeat protein
MIDEIDALPHLLLYSDYVAIANLGKDNKRVLSELIALTLDQDDLVGWRAAVAMGHVSARIADAEFARGILRRLMWMMNDESGSIGWRAPQAMGAIIAHRPHLFSEFIPIVVSMLDVPETHFYPGVLWAIGYIAEYDPELVEDALPTVLNFLRDPSPQTRGMAAWCAGQMEKKSAIPALQTLFDDSATARIFLTDWISQVSVSQLARNAVGLIKHGKDQFN